MPQSKRRELLIDTAIGLFAERGFHAAGIDLILDMSGVSKKTMYRHFRSKNELILAALKKYDGLFRNDFMRQVEERAVSPRDRMLAIFDVAETWFGRNDFFGCMFINAIGEYSGADTPIREVCKEYKAMMQRFIHDLCIQAKASDPACLAEQLFLLFEGATVSAQVSQDRSRAARVAKAAAAVLIDLAMRTPASPKGA